MAASPSTSILAFVPTLPGEMHLLASEMAFHFSQHHCPTVELTSDASGSWGCGAWYQNSWFQVPWDERVQPLPIASKELIPSILDCAAWGHQWYGHRVVRDWDNQVVVACLRTLTSKHKGLMHLLRCLVFVEAHFNCHINTRLNHLADYLSSNNLLSFLSKVPGASRVPFPVLGLLHDLLLDPRAN